MRRLPTIVALLLCPYSMGAQGLSEIRGTVVDGETGFSLPLVHVFLDGTSHGDVTADDGTFRLSAVPAGTYDLLVSYVGYERHRSSITLSGGDGLDLEIPLRTGSRSIGEVIVVDERDRVWQDQLDRFLRMFLGRSRLARDCRLLNPEVLEFTENPVVGALTARASQPLRIRNGALGYELTYWLDHFVGGDTVIDWSGNGYFRSIAPTDEGQARRWRDRRGDAYRGSVRHFLRAAARDRLFDEDFRAVAVLRPGDMDSGFAPDDMVVGDTTTGLYRIDFDHAIRVEYGGESEEPGYAVGDVRRGGGIDRPRERQVSWLSLRGVPVFFDGEGRLVDPSSLVKHGYWAWDERMASTLPWDYVPDVD